MAETLRIVPQPMRKQVEDGLRAAIVNGRFAPGEHLPDRVLCDLFGASRSVVREAVRLLEAEGLVTVVPNRGPFVTNLSVTEAEQIYEVRGVLEALAGECFARNATETERQELRAIWEELARTGETARREDLLAIKRRFYDVMLAGARNPYVARMLDQLLNRNMQLRAMSLSDPGRLKWTIRELRRVIEAIERRDADEAFSACREHVQRAAETALRLLKARDGAG
ncbi:GntR family transcriptional regulator [Methylobacterium gregans]|uniref:HTH-type transcriptional repressor RspR n=2 Tax=Methylobacterium gregans TaxID=374424 RepID=A0AA37HNC6_9HYPH|nr:DNA-binding GntR family transcriptional regulator [Methylobacterium gregans]GJD78596.1 HTH-type transcriptional repressor RspR [Methylobacterium gregans]GLS55826.1 GntR family transcriptional regulator [Methylobacterium gregans]